ncbi:MAG: N-acetyltransferase [Rhodospirillaceae bacterium]|nr:MAG: N-acetyltransferase [Rhodospirillaceae bacterium]
MTSAANPDGVIQTSHLLLRSWRDSDLPAFAALNNDPRVMEFMPKLLSREESDAMAARIRMLMAIQGFGFWAVEVPGIADFIGFVGLHRPSFEAPFTPCVEIGWRLARAYWGKGYATEAARAALAHGFTALGLNEIVSFTVPANRRSRAVMERLDMTRDPAEDFDHPVLAVGDPLRRHVLYRLTREKWRAGQDSLEAAATGAMGE